MAAPRARSMSVKGAVRRTCTWTSPTVISIPSWTGPASPSRGSDSASNNWATTSGKLVGRARIVRAAWT